MAYETELALAQELRDALLSKRPYTDKSYDPIRRGESVCLEIQDCRGHILYRHPPMEPKQLQREGFNIDVRADRGCKVSAYIRYFWFRASQQTVVKRMRLSVGPLYKNGRAYFTVRPGNSLLSSSLSKMRSRIRTGAPVRSRTGWTQKSTLRPSPETYYDQFVSYQTGRNPPFLGWVTYKTYDRSWTGVRTPGFGKLKRQRLPVNPHSVSLGIAYVQPADVKLWGPNLSSFRTKYFASWGYGPNYWTDPTGHLSTPYNKALSRLISKAELDNEANLAQDLVQMDNTLRVFVTSTARISKSYMALRKGKFGTAIKHLWGGHRPVFRKKNKWRQRGATLADNWLELQYGWKPLLQDCHGAARSLAYYVNNNADNLVRSITASATSKDEVRTNITDDSAHTNVIGYVHQYTETHVRFGIRYRVGNATTVFLSQTGFTNPLNLAWEVLPFSFVADWFIPIGNFLQALHAWDGLVFLDGFLVQFTRRVRFGYMDWGPGRLNWYDSYDTQYAGQAMGEAIRLDRTKLSSFPSPRIPEFKNPLSVTHALNGVALLTSLFAKPVTRWRYR